MPTIFASATTRDLKSYRKVVADWGKSRGYSVVIQDEFPVMSDYGTIVQMLRDKLDPCDAVIHLAGLFYGYEPTNHPDGEARRSYTQLEYELAKEHKRQVFRFIANPDYTPDNGYTQTEEQRQLQLQHRDRLKKGNEPFSGTSRTTGNELYYEFRTPDDLRALLDKIEIRVTLAKPYNLPLVGTLFKGRDEFLDQLRSVLKNKPTHIAAVTAKQAIHGLGGVGKTRVAVEYAKKYSHEYTALLFVTGDSASNLERNLANLCGALVLNLPERDAKEQEVQYAAVIRWLREHSGWFLMVDNVDTPEAMTAVETLLQKLDKGHIVITSRLSNWGPADIKEFPLCVISETAAKELLLEFTAGKRKPTPTDEAEALALANDLGYLPLALEQSGAYIAEAGCSFAEYRKLWKAQDDEVLKWHSHLMHYPRSVATTWRVSFGKVGKDGQNLLRVLCWLAPDPIPLAMLEKAEVDAGKSSLNVKKARLNLARYSFVKWSDASHTSIVVHRLVQEITEYRLPKDKRLGWLKRGLQMVNAFCGNNDPQDVRTWNDIYTPARPHLFRIIQIADESGIAEPTSRLMSVLAAYLNTRSEYAEAEPLMRQAVSIFEASLGENNPNVASALNNLAQLLQGTNRLAEAEPLIRRALAIDEKSYGNYHPNVAIRLNNLAQLLKESNRLAEAEPLMRRVASIFEASLGENHPNVASALNNLATLLQATNRLAEAEPLMRRALVIDEASYGNDHPNVAIRLNNLAQLLQATSRLAEAEPLMRRVVSIFKASLGENHPNVATALGNLSALLKETNRLAEAKPLMRQALAIDEASYGNDHPEVATDLNNLAQLLQATNRLTEAESLMRRALAINQTSYGNDHPNVARDLNNLAMLLGATNRLAEAEPLMWRALAIDEASYGNYHPNVAIRLNNIAMLLGATNRLAEAEPLMRRHLVIFVLFQKRTGHSHPHLVSAIGNYVSLLDGMDQSEEQIQQALNAITAEAESLAATK